MVSVVCCRGGTVAGKGRGIGAEVIRVGVAAAMLIMPKARRRKIKRAK